MQHPTIVNANTNERFKQMLQDAEAQRLRKLVSRRNAGRDLFSQLKGHQPVFKNKRLDESAKSPA